MRRDFLRAAAPFLITPRCAALSIAWYASESAFASFGAAFEAFTEDFKAFLRRSLITRFFLETRIAFFADSRFGIRRLYHRIHKNASPFKPKTLLVLFCILYPYVTLEPQRSSLFVLVCSTYGNILFALVIPRWTPQKRRGSFHETSCTAWKWRNIR